MANDINPDQTAPICPNIFCKYVSLNGLRDQL